MPPASTIRARALSLVSGGLDSALAVCVLREQAVDTHGIIFESPFFGAERASDVARELEIPFTVVDFTADILAILNKPRHGFGAGMNPCIDCHANMIRRAGERLKDFHCDFISTGEVLNQRPMSQNRRSLAIVAEESGQADRLLRPLSAILLPETEPERRGWVDRSRLLGIQGRSRQPQLQLAHRFGLKRYVAGTAGCRLTEPNFARRLRDLKQHEGIRDVRLIHLLQVGRHYRLDDHSRLVVGRNHTDNARLASMAESDDILLTPVDVPGPTGLLVSAAPEPVLEEAAAICARYSDGSKDRPMPIEVHVSGHARRLVVRPADHEWVENRRIGQP